MSWVPQCLLVVSLLLGSAEAPPVALSTLYSALAGRAPLTVRFRAAVDPNEDNRQLCFEWASEASSGAGCLSLDGNKAPISFWRDITFRTGGEFLVRARVDRSDGHTYQSNIVTVRVLSLGE